MFYLTYAPGPPINEFVDYFWLFEGGQTARKERIVPSGTIELVINLRDDEVRIHDREQPEKHRRFSGAVMSGTYSSIFVVSQVFAAQVGLSPKLFSRILRFQRARAMADQIKRLDWAQLASTCGYFDQSHLINDFQEFSGLSATEYLRRHQPDPPRNFHNHCRRAGQIFSRS
jgi:AraC-like DNA-binding protein